MPSFNWVLEHARVSEPETVREHTYDSLVSLSYLITYLLSHTIVWLKLRAGDINKKQSDDARRLEAFCNQLKANTAAKAVAEGTCTQDSLGEHDADAVIGALGAYGSIRQQVQDYMSEGCLA
jgi:hypothetical protein